MRSLDDWLPITSSRTASWYYSAFHNVTAIVGLGVLALPSAMSHLGWGPGIVMLVISYIITLYTMWQMVEMHEMVPGKRFDRYHELGKHAFGEKLGLWIVVPQQLVVLVGTSIVYMAAGGKSLRRFHRIVCSNCNEIMFHYCVMIFASVHFFLAQLPSLNSISIISFVAAIMSLMYSTIAWGASVGKKQTIVEYGYKSNSAAGTVFNFFHALGEVAFAFAGHSVVMEIQATIPSTLEKPAKKFMWKGVILVYIVVALCYFPVAIVCYWNFGNSVENNILLTLEDPKWLIAAAHMMVAIHLIGGYQVFTITVLDMIEGVLTKKINLPPGQTLRVVSRTWYVAFTMFMSITFPFFNDLLSFFGGFAFASTTYFLPCIMWLAIKKPGRFTLSWTINWICIVFGVLLMIATAIGSLRQLII